MVCRFCVCFMKLLWSLANGNLSGCGYNVYNVWLPIKGELSSVDADSYLMNLVEFRMYEA